MKKRVILGIGAMSLVFSMGISQAFAGQQSGMPFFGGRPGPAGQGFEGREMGSMFENLTDEQKAELKEAKGERQGRFFEEMTEEQKAEMEAARTEREQKLNEFIQTLSDDQKALYEAMTPARAKSADDQTAQRTEGQMPQKPDEAAMAAMKESREAFMASLSEAQKEAYEALFARNGVELQRREMTDEQKAEMEAKRAEYEEKMNAFIQTLSDEQKAQLEAMKPAKVEPTEGQMPQKPDEAAITAMKEQMEAFMASLTEEQKAAYDELHVNERLNGKAMPKADK